MAASIYRVMLALVLCTDLAVGQAITDSFGVVTPSDPFLFVGDVLILYCNITNVDLVEDSSNLGFKRTSQYDAPYIIPKAYITIVTSKAIRLRIPDLTLEDNGNYLCFGKRNRTIGNQVVRVDYRPKRVEKIDCLVYNWRNMTCNWTLGVDFKYPDHVSVRLVWTIDNRLQDCPELTHNSCRWPSDIFVYGAIYFMRVIVRTMTFKNKEEIAKAESPDFEVDTLLYDTSDDIYDYENESNESDFVTQLAGLKPAPIRDFQPSEETSTCIRLSWKHPSSKRREKFYVGMYQEAGTNQWNKIKANFSISKELNLTWRALQSLAMEDSYNYRISCFVCDLTPFTSYNFKVSVLPYPEGSDQMKRHGHRSEWISVPAKTREDVPGISPPLCPSCFYLHPCDHPKNDQRCVRVYWGETPVRQRHGIFKGYFISGVNYRRNYTSGTLLSPNVTQADITIPDESCEIHLTSSTSKGQSLVSSVINIPADTAIGPPAPDNFLVQTDAHHVFPLTYYLSWDPLPSDTMSQDTNVTIVWCTAAGSVYDLCKDNIKWVSVPRYNQNHTLVPDLSETFNGRINIGIATTETSFGATPISSGLKWTSCIYHRNQKPERMPENVRVAKPSSREGLTVRWDKPDCATEKAFVQSYKVRICVTEDGETCANGQQEIIRDTQDTEYTFKKEVEPMVKYTVSIAASTPFGPGPWSLPISATVKPMEASEDDTALMTAIIVIIVIIIIPLAFVVISCVRCYKKGVKRVKDEMPEVINSRTELTNFGSSEGSSGTSLYYDRVNSNQARPLMPNGRDKSRLVAVSEHNYHLQVQDLGSSASSGPTSDPGTPGTQSIYPYSRITQLSDSEFTTTTTNTTTTTGSENESGRETGHHYIVASYPLNKCTPSGFSHDETQPTRCPDHINSSAPRSHNPYTPNDKPDVNVFNPYPNPSPINDSGDSPAASIERSEFDASLFKQQLQSLTLSASPDPPSQHTSALAPCLGSMPPLAHEPQRTTLTECWNAHFVIDPAQFINHNFGDDGNNNDHDHDNNDNGDDNNSNNNHSNHYFNPSDEKSDASSSAILNLYQPQPSGASSIEDPYQPNNAGLCVIPMGGNPNYIQCSQVPPHQCAPPTDTNTNALCDIPTGVNPNYIQCSQVPPQQCHPPADTNTNALSCDIPMGGNPNYIQCSQVPPQQCAPPTDTNTNALCDTPMGGNPNYIQCSQVPPQQCAPPTDTNALCDIPMGGNPNYIECSQVPPQQCAPPTDTNTNALCDTPMGGNPNYIQCSQVPPQQCAPPTDTNTNALCDTPMGGNPNYIECSQVPPQQCPLPSQTSIDHHDISPLQLIPKSNDMYV